MPIYEYRCTECGEIFEDVRRVSRRDDMADCDHCGRNKAERVFSTPGSIRFGQPGVKGHYTRNADGSGGRF